MTYPRVVAVAPASPAATAGLLPGDEVVALNGATPRDLIEWRLLTDEPELELDVRRGGLSVTFEVTKRAGEPLGAEVHSAVFDRVQTCDNHCEFCFIYQLPPGLRSSLYLKDDDYRLSFLYGNFTTLTRFTEADLERVLDQRLSPLNVSIHATDPEMRARLLRNRRGGTSLRWLRALLDAGIDIHGQIVVCPGVNDGPVLEDTLTGVLDRYPEITSLAIVPLGVSAWSREPAMRPHTIDEATAVVGAVHEWQGIYRDLLGKTLVHCADEYYLLAGLEFPPADTYEDFAMHEDGIGMARTFELEFSGAVGKATGTRPGFFQWADQANRRPDGYRLASGVSVVAPTVRTAAPVGILTGEYGARVLGPLIATLGRDDVRVVPVPNDFFGGTTAVTGLLVGADLSRVLGDQPADHRYLLPDVCLNEGRFLDGAQPAELPRPVEVIPTDGISLRAALTR